MSEDVKATKPWWDHWRPESDYPQAVPEGESEDMSDTKCKNCGAVRAMHTKRGFCICFEGDASFEPAVPAVPDKVAPLCVHCGQVESLHSTYGQLCPNKPQTLTQFEAEPQAGAQPEPITTSLRESHKSTKSPIDSAVPTCKVCNVCQRCLNEPCCCERAGAQVPSQDQLRWDAIIKWAHANVPDAVVAIRDLAKEVVDARAHLNSIKSYATEAAKTPITREDMHDPLKAQTFFDETQGFYRLVLSEIGGGL
jgi:hypothetical protein